MSTTECNILGIRNNREIKYKSTSEGMNTTWAQT